jgi:hypothetical protein
MSLILLKNHTFEVKKCARIIRKYSKNYDVLLYPQILSMILAALWSGNIGGAILEE